MQIKAILMIYAWLPAMILIIMSDEPVLRGFASAWCFFTGMLCSVYINKTTKG